MALKSSWNEQREREAEQLFHGQGGRFARHLCHDLLALGLLEALGHEGGEELLPLLLSVRLGSGRGWL